MNSRNDWNGRMIEEFRANKGRVGGPFEGASMLLLTTTGAKSGRAHITPLVYLPDGDRMVVFGSKGGAPTNPDWYHNLVAHPDVTVETGTESFPARATIITGQERDRLYARQVERRPAFADYERKTSRKIPAIALERKRG
jgi:deazaflavin-dependent oxidoreductase (nitroreductase family)